MHQRDQRGRRPHIRLAGLTLLALVTACQAQPTATGGLASDAVLLQRIEAEIGSAACSSTADCRTLPMGSKACGGPTSWLAYSASVSRAALLQQWAQALAQSQQSRNRAEGRMSTCSVVPDPGAHCNAGRCMLVRGLSTH